MRDLVDSSVRLESLKGVLDLTELLEHLELEQIRETSNQVYALCPYHKESDPSWSICHDIESDVWGIHSCFGCRSRESKGGSGNVVTLVKDLLKIRDYDQALSYLERFCGIDTSEPLYDASIAKRLNKRRKKTADPEARFSDFPRLEPDSPEWKYLLGRGLTRKQIIDCKVRKGDGWYSNRVVFPIFSDGATLVSYYARHISDNGKKKGLNATGCSLKGVLYGYQWADIFRDTCYIVEGIFDRWAVQRLGFVNPFGLLNAAIHDSQVGKLRPFRKVVLIPDRKGNARSSMVDSAREKIVGQKVFVAEIPEGEDPCSCDPPDLLSAILNAKSIGESELSIQIDYKIKSF